MRRVIASATALLVIMPSVSYSQEIVALPEAEINIKCPKEAPNYKQCIITNSPIKPTNDGGRTIVIQGATRPIDSTAESYLSLPNFKFLQW